MAKRKQQPLTPQQQRFVQEFLKKPVAAEAYRAAGYKAATDESARAGASRLMAKPHVAAEIARRQEARSGRLQVEADRVLLEIARLAFSDVRKLFRPDGSLLPIHELDDDTAAAVASVELLEEFEGRGEERVQVGFTKKVRLAPKGPELEKLCRHLRICLQKMEVTGKDGADLITKIVVAGAAPRGE